MFYEIDHGSLTEGVFTTVGLLVLTSSDQLILILKIVFIFT
jgi:hypothetical protein